MQQERLSAFLVAAPRSGEGKTTASMALVRALVARGLKVQAFKCGPDYVDPGFLAAASGRPCPNLDTWLMGAEGVRRVFARHVQDVQAAVVEGVMGLLDGRDDGRAPGKAGEAPAQGSALDCARALGVPVLLAVDARGMARSIAALVEGLALAARRAGVRVAGVVATRVGSPRHAGMLAAALGHDGLPPLLGYLAADAALVLPSRQLGLVPAAETAGLADLLARLGRAADHLDVEAILAATEGRRPLPPRAAPARGTGAGKRLAVARDEAFCFYYGESLARLEDEGWTIVPFSPLRDEILPDADALYLGGGYPEAFAGELAANRAMREAIAAWAGRGLPLYAECGGYMYLARELVDGDGRHFPMCGVLDATARMGHRIRSLGYREAELAKAPFGLGEGLCLRGHEFHWSDLEFHHPYPPLCHVRDRDGSPVPCGVVAGPCGNVLASYLHFYWGEGSATPPGAAAQEAEAQTGEAGMARGRLLLVTGPSSAGKSTLCKELARRLGERGEAVLRLSLDAFLAAFSAGTAAPHSLEAAEEAGLPVAPAYHMAIGRCLEEGATVVADHVLCGHPGWAEDLLARIAGRALLVRLACDPAILEAREMRRTDRAGDPAHARAQALAVPPALPGELVLDSGAPDAQELAQAVLAEWDRRMGRDRPSGTGHHEFTGKNMSERDGTDGSCPEHGGNRLALAGLAGMAPADLLDFSANVRPDGPPVYVACAVTRALADLAPYPSPQAGEAVAAAAARYRLPEAALCFGNGTSELLLALGRALAQAGIPCALVPEPAFSEYAHACHLAGIPVRHPACTLREGPPPGRETMAEGEEDAESPGTLAWELPRDAILEAPRHAAVFLANPGNPAGTFLGRERLCDLVRRRPDIAWILDEAFLPYAGEDEELSLLPLLADLLEGKEGETGGLPRGTRLVVLRSLTKFHGLAGLRLGYLAASQGLAAAVRRLLPAWNVNALAIAAARAVLAASPEAKEDEEETRARNRASRADLARRLSGLPLALCRSRANYLLFRLDRPCPDLARRLAARHGIGLRDCSNYHGLSGGRWFRAAVRGPEDNARLARALAGELCPEGTPPRKGPALLRARVPALMLQGTSSHAGKSILACAFCRIFRDDGLSPCPFKAQNMSLNSGVTAGGGEMGRAQILQAQAAGVDPDVRMNPVLLKPHSDMGSQVVVLGKPVGHMDVPAYFREKKALMKTVGEAYRSLAAGHGVMVLEGAGSPGEVNLKKSDIVNMAMAEEAGASVLLVGDIDRGGLYASFLGTWLTFTDRERRLLKGFIVNRFRGDGRLLAPAHAYMLAATGVPVLGVVPYLHDLDLPEEDSLALGGTLNRPATLPDALDVAVVVLGHCANYTDFAPLGLEPDVNLRSVRTPAEWGHPHLVILPGSKNVAADLAALKGNGLAQLLARHAAKGGWIMGICGGLQILGEAIRDPERVESDAGEVAGLGLLPLSTTLAPAKTLLLERRVLTPLKEATRGYEIHHGLTHLTPAAEGRDVHPFLRLDGDGRPLARDGAGLCGVALGRRWGCYLHGLFDDDAFRRAFLDHVRADVGLAPQGHQLVAYDTEKALDRLAARVRASVDMDAIYRMLGVRPCRG